jgi:hypothetical protein
MTKWVMADLDANRGCVAVNVNVRLDGVSLCAAERKPFDVLAKGRILKQSRGDRI